MVLVVIAKFMQDVPKYCKRRTEIVKTCPMKQPDLYYFEPIKMTSQAQSNFSWRIRAAGEYSLRILTSLVTSFLWLQNSIDLAVS